MATSSVTTLDKTVISLLNNKNYATWRVQCKMALLKENLWNIVNGTEGEPTGSSVTEGDIQKFRTRKDRALAIIVLAIEPDLST